MNRLNQDMLLVPDIQLYADVQEPSFKIVFHNVRSLHKHIKDVRSNECYNCSDLLIFAETKLS